MGKWGPFWPKQALISQKKYHGNFGHSAYQSKDFRPRSLTNLNKLNSTLFGEIDFEEQQAPLYAPSLHDSWPWGISVPLFMSIQ